MMIGEVYAEGRQRVSQLVADLTEDEAALPVPTCPKWSVADVVAHLAGICADVLAGNIAGVGTEPWTEAQVIARRGESIAGLVAEWSEVGPQVEAMAQHFPSRIGIQWVTDLTNHEHDIRTALQRPGARESTGVKIGADFLVTTGLHVGMSVRGLAPLAVRAGDQTWTVGTGEPAVATDEATLRQAVDEMRAGALLEPQNQDTEIAAVGSLEAAPFDLFRALTGRRSAAQICGLGWTVDPEPYVAAFQFSPFTTSPHDVEE